METDPNKKANALAAEALKRAMKKNPPVFKIRAEISVWRTDGESINRPALLIVEECIATGSPNRDDLMSLAKSVVMGKFASFGTDTLKLDCQFEAYAFFAARSRDYRGSWLETEPDWVPAYDYMTEPVDDAKREQAIRELTYLPMNLSEQKVVHQA